MMDEKDSMLTTFDNPFNPFTDFIRWLKEDLLLGHDCCGTLAREANLSNLSSDEINDKETIEAMKRIVKDNPTIYKIVYKTDSNNIPIRSNV